MQLCTPFNFLILSPFLSAADCLSMLQKYYDYLRYELNRSTLTVEAYKLDISQFQEWLSPQNPGNTDFCSVSSSDVRAWLSSLARHGESPRTLRRKIISLRSLFKWMIKNGLLKISPLRDVPLPKIPKPLPDIVKSCEIEAALNVKDMSKPVYGEILDNLVLDILYSLGIRRAELVGINDEDVSLQKGELKVTGKRAKQRIIPIPEILVSKIREWQQFRDATLPKPDNENPLFVVKGKRITPNQVYRIVNKSLSGASAKKKSPHALRHSFASDMLNGGAEIDTVREFLGHASLSTTQIYTHISFNEIKKAYSSAHPRSSSEKK